MRTDPIYLAHCFNVAVALVGLVGVVRFLLVPQLRDEAAAARHLARKTAPDGSELEALQQRLLAAADVCQVQIDPQDPEVVTVTLRANRKDISCLFRRKIGENATAADSGAADRQDR